MNYSIPMVLIVYKTGNYEIFKNLLCILGFNFVIE